MRVDPGQQGWIVDEAIMKFQDYAAAAVSPAGFLAEAEPNPEAFGSDFRDGKSACVPGLCQQRAGALHSVWRDDNVNIPRLLQPKRAVGKHVQRCALDEKEGEASRIEQALDAQGFRGESEILAGNALSLSAQHRQFCGRWLHPRTL